MARARILGDRAARPLDGVWEIAALPPGVAMDPRDLAILHSEWMPCDGPMPVAAALRALGRWDLEHPRDFDAEDWWYRCRFRLPDVSSPVRLRFEGLATVADVWLNRHHVLRSESMFVAHTVDVTPWLRDENELVLRFHALAPLLASKRPRPKWRTSLVEHQALRWYRTSLLGRMPAWCPPVPPVGPWRPILVDSSLVQVERADAVTELDGDSGAVRLQMCVSGVTSESIAGSLTVGEWEAPLSCERLGEDRYLLTAVARIPHPDAWWPHTHGTPHLFDVRSSLTAGDIDECIEMGRVGFRTIDVARGADGQGFGLIVNGAPVFCRGACWTPLDLASLSAAPGAYRAALEQLRQGGMNMVRIGGTMTYEAEAFHDLCDELGILVWQDFMFCRMDYPADDERFRHHVTLEATQVLDALQSRPSLAVICGSSEVDQQAAMLGTIGDWGNRLFDELLPALVGRVAPGAIWLPGTPTGGSFPFQVNAGVSHYYGVGAYRRPLEDARRAGVRFAAECLAFSNIPDTTTVDLVLGDGEMPGHHPRWKTGVPRDAGVGWDFEDVRDHYVERLFGVIPAELRARDPEHYLALGRVATGEVMLQTFAEWRHPGSSCRGGLVWLARDLRPGAGWGVIDSTGLPKAAYWYLKRALAPVALLSVDEGLNGLWLHAVNDTVESIEADLRVALYRDGTRRGDSAHASVSIPARGHRSLHANALFGEFLDLTYAYRFGPPAHDVVAATLRDRATGGLLATACHFPDRLPAKRSGDCGITALAEPTAHGYSLVLETKRFAPAVVIDVTSCSPDDNYLHLEPGETRRVELRTTVKGESLRGSVRPLNGDPVSVVVVESVHAH